MSSCPLIITPLRIASNPDSVFVAPIAFPIFPHVAFNTTHNVRIMIVQEQVLAAAAPLLELPMKHSPTPTG